MHLAAIIFEHFLKGTLPLFTGEGVRLAHWLQFSRSVTLQCCHYNHIFSAVPGAGFSPRVQTLILQFPTGF